MKYKAQVSVGGKYVGTGTAMVDASVGFRPDVVWVSSKEKKESEKDKIRKARCLRALQSALDRNLDPSDPKIERIVQRLKRLVSPFDVVTQEELLKTGFIGTIFGATIQTTKTPKAPASVSLGRKPLPPPDYSNFTIIRE